MFPDKLRGEYYYELYLYTDVNLILLEDESIIDMKSKGEAYSYRENRIHYGIPDPKLTIEVKYNDVFFESNLVKLGEFDINMLIIIYNRNGQFLKQIEMSGENLNISKNLFSLGYTQLTNNSAFSSINPNWGPLIDIYKRERLIYLRDVKIDNIIK